MLRVGYRVRFSSGKGPDREGVVTALVGSMLRVRWSSQEETLVIPGPGTLTVLASSGEDAPSAKPPAQTAPKKASTKKTAPTAAVPKKAAAKPAQTEAAPKKATSSKAVARAAPKAAASRAGATKEPATGTTASAKKKPPTKTSAGKATAKSGSEKATGARRQSR